jgi:hypothetical protein
MTIVFTLNFYMFSHEAGRHMRKACDLALYCRGIIGTSVAPLMTSSVVFLSFSGQQKALYVQLGHDCFFAHAFQIHYSVKGDTDSVTE